VVAIDQEGSNMRGLRNRVAAAALAAALGATGLMLAGPPAARAAVLPGAAPKDEVTTIRVGPFLLPPAPLGTLPEQNRFVPDFPKPCTDCYITAITPELRFADGSRADMNNGVMLHHLVVAQPGAPDLTCARTDGIGAMGRRIFASGDERTPIALPEGFGFRVDPGKWIGVIELMNHSAAPQTVWFDAVVHHVPLATPGMKPVTPVWLDVNDCSNSQYAVPSGHSATPWDWRSSVTGRIVAAAGHVHAGGQGVTLDNATTGQRICASRAAYGTEAMAGMVTSMSTCSWDSLGVVHRGDDLRLTSLYDAPREMSGVMGIMLIAIYQTGELHAGTVAPASMRRTPSTAVPTEIADDEGGHPMQMGGHQHH
jgi:stress up-regulated protein Nod 19